MSAVLKQQTATRAVKKGILKNFANFTGKHLCWSLYLIKLQAWGHRYYSVKFMKFLRNLFWRTSALLLSGLFFLAYKWKIFIEETFCNWTKARQRLILSNELIFLLLSFYLLYSAQSFYSAIWIYSRIHHC